jgi:hypothetical protein
MGFWESFAQGFAQGYAEVTGETPVRRLCREAGWTIDAERGEHSTLSFRGDPIRPRRDVTISQAAGAALAAIACPCRARFTSRSLPPDLPLLLLARRPQTVGGWYAVYHERDETVSLPELTACARDVARTGKETDPPCAPPARMISVLILPRMIRSWR